MAASHMWPSLNQLKQNKKFSFVVTIVTFHVVSKYLWLRAADVGQHGSRTFTIFQKVLMGGAP